MSPPPERPNGIDVAVGPARLSASGAVFVTVLCAAAILVGLIISREQQRIEHHTLARSSDIGFCIASLTEAERLALRAHYTSEGLESYCPWITPLEAPTRPWWSLRK